MSGANFGCHKWRGMALLTSKGYRPGMLPNTLCAQDSPPEQGILVKM